MTANIQWIIQHKHIEARTVSGFSDRGKQNNHVKKHFFNAAENWKTLCGQRSPRFFEHALADTTDSQERGAIFSAAGEAYVSTIQRLTSPPRIVAASIYWRTESQWKSRTWTALGVVSDSGIWAIFDESKALALSTAYRPRPKRMHYGPFQTRHYVDAAMRKLANAEANSNRLKKRRRKQR